MCVCRVEWSKKQRKRTTLLPHCVATFSSVKRANCIPCSSSLPTICAIVVVIAGYWAQQLHCSSQVDLHVLVGVAQITEIPRAAKHISLLLRTHRHTHMYGIYVDKHESTHTRTQLYHTFGDNKCCTLQWQRSSNNNPCKSMQHLVAARWCGGQSIGWQQSDSAQTCQTSGALANSTSLLIVLLLRLLSLLLQQALLLLSLFVK